MKMGTQVVVTGGGGFIGGHVVDTLVARGYRVLAFDRHAHHYQPRPDVELFLGDVRDASAVSEAMAHADGWIHLAGVLGTQETIANPVPAAETNVLGGLNVLQAASQYGLPGVYLAVGNHWMDNTYSITKTTVERFCRMYRVERGLPVTVVRTMNAYGPRQVAAQPYGPSKVRKIMPSFICRALAGAPIEVYGDGTQVMDMVYVTDVAETLVAMLDWTAAHGPVERIIECGTGRVTTVGDIAEAVVNAVGSGEIVHLPMRPGEPEHSRVLADASTMDGLIDANRFVALEDGVRRTVDYFRSLVVDIDLADLVTAPTP